MTENARFVREQIDILSDYVREPWEELDWRFVRLHTFQLLAHADEMLRGMPQHPRER